jgi:methylated-DNA-[protein]-cysteine S-methyltransferase
MTWYTEFESPIGPLLLTSNGEALTRLFMNPYAPRPEWVRDAGVAPFRETRRQLTAYFAGELQEFDLPLAGAGTAFQQQVWSELCRIPYGDTRSYGEMARRVGQPGAARAVGLANGRNPISIIVPCHRVIGANGKLVGYGGGLDRKVALLSFEAAVRVHGPRPMANVTPGMAALRDQQVLAL